MMSSPYTHANNINKTKYVRKRKLHCFDIFLRAVKRARAYIAYEFLSYALDLPPTVRIFPNIFFRKKLI